MDAKHTPGPWEWRGKPGESELHGARGCVLGHANYEGMWLSYDANEKGRAANAQLIACAPELLDALILARKMCGLKGEVHRIIDAAIAKATGAA